MHRKATGALAVVLVLGSVGCGGEERLTRAEFVRQANAVCTKARQDAEKRARNQRGSDSPVQFVNLLLSTQRTIVTKLDDLNPPESLDEQFSEFKDQQAKRQDIYEQGLAIFRAHQERTSKMEKLSDEASGIQKRLDTLGKGLGLRSCK